MAAFRAVIPRVSQQLLFTLNVTLYVSALLPLFSDWSPTPARLLFDVQTQREASFYQTNANRNATILPVLLGMRNATGQDFLPYRKHQNYGFYYYLHVFPSYVCLHPIAVLARFWQT
ncbi:hypothetical protein MRB53_041936 [Persea americana]|nr:hypothetical protein MRB53_041936 [Persea americana]